MPGLPLWAARREFPPAQDESPPCSCPLAAGGGTVVAALTAAAIRAARGPCGAAYWRQPSPVITKIPARPGGPSAMASTGRRRRSGDLSKGRTTAGRAVRQQQPAQY